MLKRIPRAVQALTLAVTVLSVAAWAAPRIVWSVDEDHTEVNFTTRHFFTPVRGGFGAYDVQLDYDAENPAASSVSVTIDVSSVDTGNERRDAHLRTGDWFDVERWPTISFVSTSVRSLGPDRLLATGDLTIRDVTRQVELPITVLGVQDIPDAMQEMLGGATQVASFEASLTIDRGDFGVGTGSWAQTMIVAGDVDIQIALEAAAR